MPAALTITRRITAEALGRSDAPAVALQGALLDAALADLTDLLGHHFVSGAGGSRDAVLAAYAADHWVDVAPPSIR